MESKRIGTFATVYSVLLIFAIAILQTTLFSRLSIGGVTFDATLPLAIFLAVYTNEYYGSFFGLILGTLSDFIYPTVFPVMPILYLFLCALCGIGFKNMKRGFFIQKILAGLTTVVIRSLILTLIRAFATPDPIAYIFSFELWHLIYTALVSPLFMIICAPAGRASQGRSA